MDLFLPDGARCRPPMDRVLVEDAAPLLREWAEVLRQWVTQHPRAPWPLAARAIGDEDELLEGFLQWWSDTDQLPAKLPNALQVRTIVRLVVRSLEKGIDLTGGRLSGRIPQA